MTLFSFWDALLVRVCVCVATSAATMELHDFMMRKYTMNWQEHCSLVSDCTLQPQPILNLPCCAGQFVELSHALHLCIHETPLDCVGVGRLLLGLIVGYLLFLCCWLWVYCDAFAFRLFSKVRFSHGWVVRCCVNGTFSHLKQACVCKQALACQSPDVVV